MEELPSDCRDEQATETSNVRLFPSGQTWVTSVGRFAKPDFAFPESREEENNSARKACCFRMSVRNLTLSPTQVLPNVHVKLDF